jgi:hypothetical protein
MRDPESMLALCHPSISPISHVPSEELEDILSSDLMIVHVLCRLLEE